MRTMKANLVSFAELERLKQFCVEPRTARYLLSLLESLPLISWERVFTQHLFPAGK